MKKSENFGHSNSGTINVQILGDPLMTSSHKIVFLESFAKRKLSLLSSLVLIIALLYLVAFTSNAHQRHLPINKFALSSQKTSVPLAQQPVSSSSTKLSASSNQNNSSVVVAVNGQSINVPNNGKYDVTSSDGTSRTVINSSQSTTSTTSTNDSSINLSVNTTSSN